MKGAENEYGTIKNFPKNTSNPFGLISTKQVLSDLSVSRQQIEEGKGLDMEDALEELGKQEGRQYAEAII